MEIEMKKGEKLFSFWGECARRPVAVFAYRATEDCLVVVADKPDRPGGRRTARVDGVVVVEDIASFSSVAGCTMAVTPSMDFGDVRLVGPGATPERMGRLSSTLIPNPGGVPYIVRSNDRTNGKMFLTPVRTVGDLMRASAVVEFVEHFVNTFWTQMPGVNADGQGPVWWRLRDDGTVEERVSEINPEHELFHSVRRDGLNDRNECIVCQMERSPEFRK